MAIDRRPRLAEVERQEVKQVRPLMLSLLGLERWVRTFGTSWSD
jgi:hypothetical protein